MMSLRGADLWEALRHHESRASLVENDVERLPRGIQELLIDRTRSIAPNHPERPHYLSTERGLRHRLQNPNTITFLFLAGGAVGALVVSAAMSLLTGMIGWFFLGMFVAASTVFTVPLLNRVLKPFWGRLRIPDRFVKEHRLVLAFADAYWRNDKARRFTREERACSDALHDEAVDLVERRDVLVRNANPTVMEREALSVLDRRLESVLTALVEVNDVVLQRSEAGEAGQVSRSALTDRETEERRLAVAARVLAEESLSGGGSKLQE